MMKRMSAVMFFTIVPTLCATHVDSFAQGEALLSWVSEAHHPLAIGDGGSSTSDLIVVGEMIGDARIVALGEGIHGAAEPLVFRNHLFRYLVEERGFSAIAIESGTVESRVIDDYVQGEAGELEEVVAQGFSATMDDFPQNAALVSWMRSYNQGKSASERIRFFGFDVPGSPTNGFSIRGVDTAIKEAIAFLRQVDETSAGAIENRIAPLLPLSLDNYGQLSEGERDRFTGIVSDLVGQIQRREWAYVQASSRADYDWALVAALGARQIDTFLRFLPLSWVREDGYEWAGEAGLYRDRAMMENMEWILSQLGDDDRVLLFGALTHLSAVPVIHEIDEQQQVSFGVYLNQRYSADIVTIGNVISNGAIGNCPRGPLLELEPPPESTLSYTFAAVGVPQYVVDLRASPPAVAVLLDQPNRLWTGLMSFSLPVSEVLDIAYFSGPVTPACSGAE
jgi:erythromycin esterase